MQEIVVVLEVAGAVDNGRDNQQRSESASPYLKKVEKCFTTFLIFSYFLFSFSAKVPKL